MVRSLPGCGAESYVTEMNGTFLVALPELNRFQKKLSDSFSAFRPIPAVARPWFAQPCTNEVTLAVT